MPSAGNFERAIDETNSKRNLIEFTLPRSCFPCDRAESSEEFGDLLLAAGHLAGIVDVVGVGGPVGHDASEIAIGHGGDVRFARVANRGFVARGFGSAPADRFLGCRPKQRCGQPMTLAMTTYDAQCRCRRMMNFRM